MTEISIVLPLSALQGVTLTPEAIVENLSNAVQLKEQLSASITQYNELVDVVNSLGGSLTVILDETEGFDKVRALRNFAEELKGVRRMKRPEAQ